MRPELVLEVKLNDNGVEWPETAIYLMMTHSQRFSKIHSNTYLRRHIIVKRFRRTVAVMLAKRILL